ncbi:DinB family protein [Kribbella sp. NPDC000426]|uniref:DinB family protein n=1 Tax=Kribbella sp. NPDC000426 TaxID=3154255 RepID=UPI0033197871
MDEKALLLKHLDEIQQSLLWKVEGLSDAELRRPMTGTGTNLIGIVKHLTGVTYGYLVSAFGREREVLPWEDDEELWHGLDLWATPDESPEELIAAYRRACAAGALAVEELDLETLGTHHSGSTVTLREMVLTVLLDTTRHAGHADVVRELVDGRVGSRPADPMSPDDPEYLRMYRARMTGEIDRETWMAYVKSQPSAQSQGGSGAAGWPDGVETAE